MDQEDINDLLRKSTPGWRRRQLLSEGKSEKIISMPESDECLGRYATKRKAQEMATAETQSTGRLHKTFFTHYYCPYDFVNKSCWTVILSR